MEALRPGLDLEGFFENLRRGSRSILFLDFDGTLAPFRAERDRARTYPGVDAVLARILGTGRTRVVLVSGRPVRDLAAQFSVTPSPEIWGSYGLEHLGPDGAVVTRAPAPAAAAALDAERSRLAVDADASRFEIKPAGLALHLRGVPPVAAQSLYSATEARWRHLAAGCGLRLIEFDGGLELVPAEATKAVVVEVVLGETAANGAVAFLGDDASDEEAFAALGDRGLAVLVRPERRATRADLWLRPPEELLQFLRRWDSACKPEAAS